MGKNFCIIFLIPLLFGCSPKPKIEDVLITPQVEVTTHNYYEVQEFTISWQKIFDVSKPNYYVYIYSPTCSHCADLKDWIIETALVRQDIYFVKASENDVIVKNTTHTIGATKVSELAILGYPSMFKIDDKILTKNVAGKTNIQNLLKQHN